jgi:hypothetical protein
LDIIQAIKIQDQVILFWELDRLYIENTLSDSPLIWGDFSGDRIVINGNATDNPNSRTFFVNGGAGGLYGWFNDSDKRLKKDITPIPDALEKVLMLRGVNYMWKDPVEGMESLQMGFIGQEAEKVIPEVVSNRNDHYSMQYAPITALLVEAVKEQQMIIREKDLEIRSLTERLERIEALLEIYNPR